MGLRMRIPLPGGAADHLLPLPLRLSTPLLVFLLLLAAPRQGSAWQVKVQQQQQQQQQHRSHFHPAPSLVLAHAVADEDCGDDAAAAACLPLMARALGKMAQIGTPAFASRFNRRRMKSVEVRESTLPGAGLGLFATRDIKSGTIVAFYPAHVLGMSTADGETVMRVRRDAAGAVTVTTDGHEEDKEEGEAEDRNEAYLHHLLGRRPLMGAGVVSDLGGIALFIDVDIGREASPGFDGHRVNDGATAATNDEEGALRYYRASRLAKNCVHVPFGPAPLLATVATKKIRKGSELFTTYGCSYWLDALRRQTGEAEETSMTERIVAEAREVAMDVLEGMKGVAATHAREAEELQAIFDSEA